MSNVSRSVYQKLAEENKRLRADIFKMVMFPLNSETIKVRSKWRKKFEEQQLLRQTLHEHAVQYIKDHPDCVAAQIAREFAEGKK